jgi:type IV pilus assembly protein PilN
LLNGYAQSNERVSELLRNLGNASPWLEHPELLEIKAATVGQGKEARRVFEFSMNVGVRRQREKEGAPAAPNTVGAASNAVAATTPGKL